MDDQDDAGALGKGKATGQGLGAGRAGAGEGNRGTPYFSHERLVAFQVADQCEKLVAPWLKRKMPVHLRDQFDRAMVSMTSNIAEGAGKTSWPDKRRAYEIARGSTNEAGAQLSILHARAIITPQEYGQARALLLRVGRLLHGLCTK